SILIACAHLEHVFRAWLREECGEFSLRWPRTPSLAVYSRRNQPRMMMKPTGKVSLLWAVAALALFPLPLFSRAQSPATDAILPAPAAAKLLPDQVFYA